MRGAQAVMLTAPSLAMLVVAIALFGPGAVRPFEGAQIFGGPTEGVARLSFRVVVLRRFRGIDNKVAGRSVVVRIGAGDTGSAVTAECAGDEDGTCDVDLALAAPHRGPLDMQVTSGRELLAAGSLVREATGWGERGGHAPDMAGVRRGDLEVHLYALRGVVAAPFPDELTVLVLGKDGAPSGGARITARIEAGDIAPASDGEHRQPSLLAGEPAPAPSSVTLVADARGRVNLSAVPRAHAVEVSLEANSNGLSGSFLGWLPVIPGAMWLDPESRAAGELRVVAPVARERAYVTLSSRSGRLWGGSIPLLADAHGFAAGRVPWPAIPLSASEPAWLTLASDASATGAGTVGWPVFAPAGDMIGAPERAFSDWLLLDGMPRAERHDSERRQRAGWLAITALASAAVLEAILLAERARAAREAQWARVAAAIATIVLAFAAIGIVAVWKMSG